jgi:hypothetical protein
VRAPAFLMGRARDVGVVARDASRFVVASLFYLTTTHAHHPTTATTIRLCSARAILLVLSSSQAHILTHPSYTPQTP